ncbi:PEP-CTERM sorting domain-containing protein [Anabaena minutissima FACHB-250]|nr:PEP-CTERM sorting domain-containing protein [Anabaena minutissima FACHB-250]
MSHDSVNRFLLRERYEPKDLFDEVKQHINLVGGTLSADDNFTTAGTYTLGFGVVDVGDTTVNSALLVDNVKLTPVPEPTTMFGILMGMGFGYAAKLRFSPQQKKPKLK